MVDFGVGITCTIVAAILYGLQYIPCKQYCTYDGAVFQWFMCSGILWGGIVLEIVGMLSGQWDGPQIFLYGVLSEGRSFFFSFGPAEAESSAASSGSTKNRIANENNSTNTPTSRITGIRPTSRSIPKRPKRDRQ
mmetsp:Transcript_23732/g.20198  ORF Transcript_23732/g.20198 Transcript_23732/m.20198 type:complete len:135 (-) Transcript_23732:295-699(-)